MSPVGSTSNGDMHETARLDGVLSALRRLTRMDGSSFFAYSLWHYPDDVHFYDVDKDAIDEYLQCAGSAGAMTVEMRVADPDGGFEQFTLGKGPAEGDPVAVPWQNHVVEVYPAEVFTAEEAQPIFEQYFRTGTVPEGLYRRSLDLG